MRNVRATDPAVRLPTECSISWRTAAGIIRFTELTVSSVNQLLTGTKELKNLLQHNACLFFLYQFSDQLLQQEWLSNFSLCFVSQQIFDDSQRELECRPLRSARDQVTINHNPVVTPYEVISFFDPLSRLWGSRWPSSPSRCRAS